MENELTEVIQCAEWLERLTIQASLGKISKRFALIESSLNLRRLHARNQELEKDLNGAKRLVSKVWNQHPEAREAIEEGTGAWMVFGQDVETSVSAQRVTQAAAHIGQPLEMVAAPVVLPEPIGTVGAAPGTSGFALAVFEAARVPVGTNIYTEQQVRELLDKATCTKSQTVAQEPFGYFKAEPFGWRDCAETDEGAVALYTAPQPQADARDAELLDWLESEVCDSHTGVTINRIDHREDGMVIERGFRLRRFHKDYEVKPTLRAAIAAAKEMK